MVRERDDLHVVDLAERDVDRQLVGVGVGGSGEGLRILFERMHVADQRTARVGQVRDIGVGWRETRGSGIRVAGVARQQDAAPEAEDAEVAPVARVEFLPVHDERPGRRCRVDPHPARGDVGDALLLVHDEILDDVEILGLRLQHEVRRGVAVVPAVIHVHVHVGAHPAPLAAVEPRPRGKSQVHLRRRAGAHLNRAPLGRTRQALHQLDAHGPRGDFDHIVAGGMEVARLERLLVAVELRMMGPGMRGRVEPPARVRDHRACGGK